MGKFRKSDELLYWRFFLLLYMAGFAAGIIFVNLAWKYRTRELEALTLFSLQGSSEIRTEGYLWYLVRERGGMLLAAHALGVTVLGSYAVIAGLLWTGFLGGNAGRHRCPAAWNERPRRAGGGFCAADIPVSSGGTFLPGNGVPDV